MFLVRNERIKLTANWLNALATALLAAGAFAPAAAFLYGLSILPAGGFALGVLVAACFAFSACLHFAGWTVLGRLRE